jgi:hypothetical protein
MAGSLKRVLRIRALQEERSRVELEAEIGRLRELERAAAAAAREARESRERSFADLRKAAAIGSRIVSAGVDGNIDVAKGPSEQGNWREAELEWGTAVWRQEGHEAKRPEQERTVDRARGEFLDGRRERLQAETLVEQTAARELVEAGRREQRALDDWFQGWARRLRGEKQL